MGLQFTPENDVIAAFSTPIARFRVSGCETLNVALRDVVLGREANTPGVGRTNIRGWHSPDDIMDWPDDCIVQLKGYVMEAVQNMVAVLSGVQDYTCTIGLAGWANVLHTGNYNKEHVHPECTVSGVYYVDVGASDPNDKRSGRFEFMDPRHLAEMVPTPGTPFGRTLPVQPQDGLMLVFPSWLYHAVRPYTGIRPRISISFNATITKFKANKQGGGGQR